MGGDIDRGRLQSLGNLGIARIRVLGEVGRDVVLGDPTGLLGWGEELSV